MTLGNDGVSESKRTQEECRLEQLNDGRGGRSVEQPGDRSRAGHARNRQNDTSGQIEYERRTQMPLLHNLALDDGGAEAQLGEDLPEVDPDERDGGKTEVLRAQQESQDGKREVADTLTSELLDDRPDRRRVDYERA